VLMYSDMFYIQWHAKRIYGINICMHDKYGKKKWWGIAYQLVKLHWLICNFLSFSFKIFISNVLNDCIYFLYFFIDYFDLFQ
jgi:hypothetical protein